MSLLSGAIHAVGTVAGPATEALGAVTSLGGLAPNQTATRLTDIGHSITDPNVVYAGTINPLSNNFQNTGGAAWNTASHPQTLGAVTTNPQGSPQPGNTPTGNQAYYGSSAQPGSGNPAAYNAFVGSYDNQVNGLQNQYGALDAYRNADINNIDTLFNPQANTLQAQHHSGLANLDLAQNQLDTQRSQGLRNLGNQLRGALNGYQNQIGVMGAGNSSAAPMLGYALTQQGNRQMADMNQNYAQQQTGLNQQRSDLETNFKNQMDNLGAWKQSQLNTIASQYGQKQQALQQAIMQAQGDKARYLAMYGQTALANDALNQMKQLEAQYSDQIGQLHSQFQNTYAPQADLSQYTGQPNINPITPGQLSQLDLQNNAANPDNTSATASLLKRPDQSPSTNFGY